MRHTELPWQHNQQQNGCIGWNVTDKLVQNVFSFLVTGPISLKPPLKQVCHFIEAKCQVCAWYFHESKFPHISQNLPKLKLSLSFILNCNAMGVRKGITFSYFFLASEQSATSVPASMTRSRFSIPLFPVCLSFTLQQVYLHNYSIGYLHHWFQLTMLCVLFYIANSTGSERLKYAYILIGKHTHAWSRIHKKN